MVGLLHSQTGPMAISEKSLIDAEVLALEEINAPGRDRRPAGLKWEIADGRSDPSTFATEARRLIEADRPTSSSAAGPPSAARRCWRSSRSSGSLLSSRRTSRGSSGRAASSTPGARPIRSVLPGGPLVLRRAEGPAVLRGRDGGGLVAVRLGDGQGRGQGGRAASWPARSYLPLVGGDAGPVVAAIRAAGPTWSSTSLVGDSNVPFYAALRRAGLTPDRLPVVAFSVAEDELRRFPPGDVAGHYAAWSYFQSVDRAENLEFVRRFKARYGEARVISDAMVAAYNGVMLWAQAANEAGTGDPEVVLDQLDRQSLDAPEGIVTDRPGVAGRLAARSTSAGPGPTASSTSVWSIAKPIHPVTYRPAPGRRADWLAFARRPRGPMGRPVVVRRAVAPEPDPHRPEQRPGRGGRSDAATADRATTPERPDPA